jgi:circadian clock protein KaiB
MTRARAKVPAKAVFELRLYVAGQSTRSIAAFRNLRRICDTHLAGRCDIDRVLVGLDMHRL